MANPRIQNFISNLDSNKGPAKSERFYVQITPPTGIPALASVANPTWNLQFQCDISEIPGISLEPQKYRFYGPDRNIAIGTMYQEIIIEIVCTNSFYEKPWFDAWVNLINPIESGWDLNYKSIYTGTLTIIQLDLQSNPIYSVNLINAWPGNVAALPLRWADDSFHKLQVTFHYDRYENNSTPFVSLLSGF